MQYIHKHPELRENYIFDLKKMYISKIKSQRNPKSLSE